MGTKREEYRLRGGDILEIREFTMADMERRDSGGRKEKADRGADAAGKREREDPEMPVADDDVLP